MTTLNTNKLQLLGEDLNTFLIKEKIDKAVLNLYVDETSFLKLDEDLFYRLNTEGEFQPSENQINISFDRISFIIQKENKKEG